MDYLSEEIYQYKLATIGNRIAAGLIDFIAMGCLLVIVGLIFGETYTNADNDLNVNLSTTSSLIFFSAWVLAFPVAEGYFGQTIGKKMVGIKVIHKNGKKANILQSLIRHLFDMVDYFLLIGLIIAAANINKQRIGDLIANTIVVKK